MPEQVEKMAEKSLARPIEPDVITLRPSKGLVGLQLKDLWHYRELIFFLTWRDILVRYKQTLLGAAWAVINPLINMLVLTIIFGSFAQMSTEGYPRQVFTFAALLPWGLFAKAVNDAGRSMLTNRSMITKVYFPRLIVPLASVLGGLLDFVIAFVVLLGMMFYFQIGITTKILLLPGFILLALVASLGVGLWLSALHVNYRDVGYIIPFLTQLLLLITPVAYSASEVPVQWQWLYAMNPMVGVVEGFRWALLGGDNLSWLMLGVSTAVALLLLVSGLYYFRYMERTFADMI